MGTKSFSDLKQKAKTADRAGRQSRESTPRERGGPGDTPAGEEPDAPGMFARAQENATAAAPVDATFAPVSAPEQTGMLAMAGGRDSGRPMEGLVFGDDDSGLEGLATSGMEIGFGSGGGLGAGGMNVDVDDPLGGTGGML